MKTPHTSIDNTKGIDKITQNDIAKNSGIPTADISQQHTFHHQNFNAMPKTAVSKKRPSTGKVDIYERATQRIIDLLKQGDVAWYRKTWSGYGLARNYKTNHIYTGINLLFMNMISPHPIPYYLTFNQVKEMGGKIQKGAKAEYVYFYKGYYKDENGKNISEVDANSTAYSDKPLKSVRFLKCYPVFNIEQTENIEWERPALADNDNDPILECEMIMNEMPNPPKLERIDSNNAYYSPTDDVVNMPNIRQFESSKFFYRTLFHETAHSTGHPSRLGRFEPINTPKFGTKNYAEEELVAEICSSYLLSLAGVNTKDVMKVSTGYLKSWIQRLEDDPKLIFRVAAKAQQATEYILGKKIIELPI